MKSSNRLLYLILIASLSACGSKDTRDNWVGYIEVEWEYVSSPRAGFIKSIHVQQGQIVNKDQSLYQLDISELQSEHDKAIAITDEKQAILDDLSKGARAEEIKQMLSALDQARANYARITADKDRVVELAQSGAESQSKADQLIAEYLSAKAALESAQQAVALGRLGARPDVLLAAHHAKKAAEADLQGAQWRLTKANGQATSAGMVSEIFYFAGEYVPAGAPIIAIQPNDALFVKFFVNEAQLPLLNLAQTIRVYADGQEHPVTAKVSFISQHAEFTPPVIYSKDVRDKLVFLVEARLEDAKRLPPGLPVSVSL